MACRLQLLPKRHSRVLNAITILATVAAMGSTAGRASAGPNEGGTLILHANVAATYTTDASTYCGQPGLADCGLAVTTVSALPTVTTVLFAIAAFPPGGSPRLAGVTFGIDYDPEEFLVVASGHCGDFELAMDDWPDSGKGTALSWVTPATTQLVVAYWFAGHAYSIASSGTFALVPHPTQGASFADDTFPAARMDPVAAMGWLGFGGVEGFAPCPDQMQIGGGNGGSGGTIDGIISGSF